jgi:transposase
MEVRAKVVQTWQRLTRSERQNLKRLSMRSGNAVVRCRCKVVVGLVQGKSPSTLASGQLCSIAQVYRVAHRFIRQGCRAVADRREDNGCNKVDEKYGAKLLAILAGSPQDHGYLRPTWTQELLIRVLAERTGIVVSTTTMSRLLKRLGVRHGRPKPIVGCPWPKARKNRRLSEIKRLIRDLHRGEVAVYVDEVDIHLNPKIGLDWMMRGQQRSVVTPGKNQKRYLAGALEPRTGRVTYVEGNKKNSLLFLQLLYRLVTRTYRNARRIYVILDNYGIHDSLQVRLALKSLKGRVKFLFLPPYCPDHNPIERVWQDLHANVTRNHKCHSLDQLMMHVRLYLRARNRRRKHAYARGRAA